MEQTSNEKRYVLVCQSLFCLSRGSWHVLNELRQQEQGGELPENMEVRPYYCFNGCSHGPNVVCYPEKTWFERVSQANLPQVLNYLNEGTLPTDPGLNQRRVLEVVRQTAYAELEKELGNKGRPECEAS